MREPIRYLSLFSGVEAAHLAWAPLGWECVGVAEIDSAASRVLAHRLPGVPNLGSVTEITREQIAALGRIDVLIGGSPCQDLSIAGKRSGLAGRRSGLFHEQMRIFDAARSLCGARWCVWENVPGAFSSHGGADFAVVVGTMAGCELDVPAEGWGTEGVALGDAGLVEWSVLDAQWFGVAQRRRRVFAVLDTGDWSGRPPVLLEPESLRGDFAPRREAGEEAPAGTGGGASGRRWPADVACTLNAAFGDKLGLEDQHALNGAPLFVPAITNALTAHNGHRNEVSDMINGLIAFGCKDSDPTAGIGMDVAPTLRAMGHAGSHANAGGQVAICATGEVFHTLTADGFDASEDGTGRGAGAVVAFDTTQITSAANYSNPKPGDPCHPLTASGHPPAAAGREVRRLTPRECERLQGMPDDWTLVPNGKKLAPDGARYKQTGNSFAVPVIRWIGRSLQRAHDYSPAPVLNGTDRTTSGAIGQP